MQRNYQHYLYTLSMTEIQSICVCGAGTMGSGIAQVAAAAGFNTLLYEVNESVLERAVSSIRKNLQALVKKNKLTAEEDQRIFQRIHFINDYRQCIADIIVEAVVENLQAKASLLNQLSEMNGSGTIYTTNTSSLSVTEIAKRTSQPERVIGMHFFNPAPVMKLVEVVKTDKTSGEVLEATVGLAKRFGKTPVVCKDSPGFIVNRVARPFYIESLRLIEEGEVDFATVDALLEATGFKMGPFKLMDLIGNDVNYAVSQSVYEQLKKPERLKPSFIQRQKVEKGELGKKTGKGYYQY